MRVAFRARSLIRRQLAVNEFGNARRLPDPG
jgi:hypothetical protein